MNLTQSIVNKCLPKERRYSLHDDMVPGLLLRIDPSGIKRWYLDYQNPRTGKRTTLKLGDVRVLSPAQARDAARKKLAAIRITGVDPIEERKQLWSRLTLGDIVAQYEPWVQQNRKSARQTINILSMFRSLFSRIAEDITAADIDQWQRDRSHLNPKTINRQMASIQSMLNWAVKRGLIQTNPIKGKVERKKEPSSTKIRYLSPEERKDLLTVLEKRDRRERDYLKCAVLLSLNTGIRKGTLLGLLWSDVDWDRRTLRLRAEIMKGGKEKTIPLNEIALKSLLAWYQRSGSPSGENRVFLVGDTKKPWDTICKKIGAKSVF